MTTTTITRSTTPGDGGSQIPLPACTPTPCPAMLAAAIFAGIWLMFSYLLVKAARAHAGVSRSVLGPPRPWA